MSLADSDKFLVCRNQTPYQLDKENLMADLKDDDLMLVNREVNGSWVPYKATGKEVKDSFDGGGGGGIQPSPNDIEFDQSVSGSGTKDDPYILNTRLAAPAGSTINSSETITLNSQPPEKDVIFTDLSTDAGTRFNQPTTKTDEQGGWSGKLQYADSPDSTEDTDYVGNLQLGTIYFRWTVEQKLVDRVATEVKSVSLVESSPEGTERFTSSNFAFTSQITDGSPLSTKTFNAYVSGTFDTEVTPQTSEVMDVASTNGPLSIEGDRHTEDISTFVTDNGITGITGFRMNFVQGFTNGFYAFTTNGNTYAQGNSLVITEETGTGYPGGNYSWTNWANSTYDIVQYETDTTVRFNEIAVDGTTTLEVHDYSDRTDNNLWLIDQDGAEWQMYGNLTKLTLTDNKVYDAGEETNLSLSEGFPEGTEVTDVSGVDPGDAAAFATKLYEGTGGTPQSIETGFKPDLVWIKTRNVSGKNHTLYDTKRGALQQLSSNTTDKSFENSNSLTSFDSNGFSVGSEPDVNGSVDRDYVSWSFRAGANFFDCVQWTGDNVVGREIPHSLEVEPGFMIVKTTDATDDWPCFHRDIGSSGYLKLNSYDASESSTNMWGSTAPTSTHFTVANNNGTNGPNRNYIGYLFAKEGPGIKCGQYQGNGTSQQIETGFDTGFVLLKAQGENHVWCLFDSERPGKVINPASSADEGAESVTLNSTGFAPQNGSIQFNFDGYFYVYVAIAKDAMAPGAAATGKVSGTADKTLNLTDVSGTWQEGSKAEAPESVKEITKMYLKHNADGDVTDLQLVPMDPRVTTTATNPSLTLKFPAEFPSGQTPDEELGAGTTLTVGVASENVVNRSPETGFEEASVQPKLDPTIADFFATSLWTGTGGTPEDAQDINTGIDLTNNDGMVWIKVTDQASTDHNLFNTKSGDDKYLSSNSEDEEFEATGKCVFTSTGYRVGGQYTNNTGKSIVGWTFRCEPNFFDVVQYEGQTGTGDNNGTYSHSLGSVPGLVIIKRLDVGETRWLVYHKELTLGSEYLVLNDNGSLKSDNYFRGLTADTFSVGPNSETNASDGAKYNAYLFADNEELINCGGYTGSGGTSTPEVACGFEPSFVMIKRTDGLGSWVMYDTTRNSSKDGTQWLYANSSAAEAAAATYKIELSSNGFTPVGSSPENNGDGGEYIYVAIAAPVTETLTAEAFAEQSLRFATYENREAVKQGEEAMEKREKMMEGLRESGMTQEQIDKLGLQ